MNDITQLVSTLGFPIAMCIGACFFIKYLFDTFTKQQEEMRKEHKEEVMKLQASLDNNTLVLQKLIDKLGDDK